MLVGLVDGSAQRAFLRACIIERTRSRVISVKIRHLKVTLGDLRFELSAQVIPIEMLKTAALGEQREMTVVELHLSVSRFSDVFLVFLTEHQFADF